MKYLSPLLLIIYTIKSLFFGTSLGPNGDAFAFVSLSGLFGFIYYLESKKEKPINEKTLQELAILRNDLEVIKSSLSSLKFNIRKV